jgi:hypothetical protein
MDLKAQKLSSFDRQMLFAARAQSISSSLVFENFDIIIINSCVLESEGVWRAIRKDTDSMGSAET